MNTPVFTETMQIGIVVRDLDAAMRHYGDDFGIGPWKVMQLTPADTQQVRIYGTPAPYASRVATAMVGQVMWELIEPLDDDSLFARFLAEKGGGVHHIAVATPNFEATLAKEAERGRELALSGTFSGIQVAFLATDQDLGVLLEVFSGLPQEDDA